MARDYEGTAMKEVEDKTWELLTEGSPPGTEVVKVTTMTDLVKKLPNRVSENAKKLVSTGTMFAILLSLATKHNLTLKQHPDLKDVTVMREPRPGTVQHDEAMGPQPDQEGEENQME